MARTLTKEGRRAARGRWALFGALAVTGCLEAEATPLPDEARSALLELLDNPVTARFDEARVVAVGELGLLCGGRVSFTDRRGARIGWLTYHYRRGRGMALEGRDPALFDELRRECERVTRP